jgi:hypothetical protein
MATSLDVDDVGAVYRGAGIGPLNFGIPFPERAGCDRLEAFARLDRHYDAGCDANRQSWRNLDREAAAIAAANLRGLANIREAFFLSLMRAARSCPGC